VTEAPGPARGAEAGGSERFLAREHIRRRRDFLLAYDKGRRVSGRFMTVFLLANRLPDSRLGIAATRKIGDAVRRNRAKRLVRELYRRNNFTAGFDIVVIPRREIFDANYGSLEADYRALLRRAIGR
jgi:ribonuclease P protein component